jgi:hypothetical protein
MKTLRGSSLFFLLLVSMVAVMFSGIIVDQDTGQAIAQSGPILLIEEKMPEFAAVSDGTTVVLAWAEVDGAEGYRLLFSFANDNLENNSYEIDVGLDTEFILDLEDQKTLDMFDENFKTGLPFHVSVEACDLDGVCRQSNVEYVRIGLGSDVAEDIQRAPQNVTPNKEIPSNISPQLSCSLFVEPARSCVLGTDIFVPVGGTNPFTASGGTDGFTMSSNNPGVVIGGFDSPSQGLGWITGVSEGSTQINIWDGQGCRSAMTVKVLPANGSYIYMSDVNPPPYPYSRVSAGVAISFSYRLRYPAVSGRYYKLKYALGMLDGTASNANSEEIRRIVHSNTQTLESSVNATSWSKTITLTGTLPYGWDYLLIWYQYLDSDQTTVLAESCRAGWLIDNIIIN